MDNADLEKLRVSPGKLSPKFKASVLSYSVTVASSVAELKLTVLTSDSGASYTIKVSFIIASARLHCICSLGYLKRRQKSCKAK